MWVSNNGRFNNKFTFVNGIFNFSCPKSMSTYIDYIVNSPDSSASASATRLITALRGSLTV